MKTSKLMELVDLLDIKVEFIDKKTHGTFNPKTNEIRLNVETMIVEVFVHEVMHMISPLLNRKCDEEVIDTLTERVYHRLTEEQIRKIAKKLLEAK